MFDDIVNKKPSKEKFKDALIASGIGKCKQCSSYQSSNGLCNKITKIVHPEQIGCLDFKNK